jgi:hypothetical protein
MLLLLFLLKYYQGINDKTRMCKGKVQFNILNDEHNDETVSLPNKVKK